MSLIAPPDAPGGAPGGPEHLGVNAWVLCAEFVERIVAEAQATAARSNLGHAVPEADWVLIWRAGDGATSDESAIGRIVRTASEVAEGIARGTVEPFSSEAGQRDWVDGRVGIETASIRQPAVWADRMALVDRPTARMDPSTAVVDPLTALFESPTALVDPATTVVGPPTAVVEPVGVTVDPVTVPTPVVVPRVLREAGQGRGTTPCVTRTPSEWVAVFTWLRNVGAILLLFVVWQLWGTSIAQHQAQGRLQAEFEASVRAHHAPTASKPVLVPATSAIPAPTEGSVVAELQIPAIGVDQYVVQGTNSTDLAMGPGHYVGTAMPGQAGNVAIAGHRTTHGAPFNRLGQLAPRDQIILTTLSGQHWTYLVSAPAVAVSPHDVSVLNYFGDNRITLTTCNPEFSSSQRLIVVGLLKEPSAAPMLHPQHLSYHIENSATASWNWSMLPAVGVEVCLLALLGLSYRRFDGWFGPTGRWLILVPVWAAGLYLLFTSLTSFLPSTF